VGERSAGYYYYYYYRRYYGSGSSNGKATSNGHKPAESREGSLLAKVLGRTRDGR
jgi:hypothetical protein